MCSIKINMANLTRYSYNHAAYLKAVAIASALLMLLGPAAAMDPTDGSDAKQDTDHDGLNNAGEFQYGTDPNDSDTDSDLTDDGWEVHFRGVWLQKNPSAVNPLPFNPTRSDAGSMSASAIAAAKQNPTSLYLWRDSDVDGLNDPDGDGWNNLHEFLAGTDPTSKDTDGDKLDDAVDYNPLIPDAQGSTNPGGTGGDGQKQTTGTKIVKLKPVPIVVKVKSKAPSKSVAPKSNTKGSGISDGQFQGPGQGSGSQGQGHGTGQSQGQGEGQGQGTGQGTGQGQGQGQGSGQGNGQSGQGQSQGQGTGEGQGQQQGNGQGNGQSGQQGQGQQQGSGQSQGQGQGQQQGGNGQGNNQNGQNQNPANLPPTRIVVDWSEVGFGSPNKAITKGQPFKIKGHIEYRDPTTGMWNLIASPMNVEAHVKLGSQLQDYRIGISLADLDVNGNPGTGYFSVDSTVPSDAPAGEGLLGVAAAANNMYVGSEVWESSPQGAPKKSAPVKKIVV